MIFVLLSKKKFPSITVSIMNIGRSCADNGSCLVQ